MDLLDRLLAHDSWTTRQLLLKASDLSEEKLDHEIDIGHKTLRLTFLHLIRNMEVWSELMDGRVPDQRQSTDNSINELIKRLDSAAELLATVACSIRDRNGWDERWIDSLDGIEKTYGGGVAHILTHSMHHRAQILYMLRLHGATDLPEGDVLSWESASQR